MADLPGKLGMALGVPFTADERRRTCGSLGGAL